MSPQEFEELVHRAVASLPPEFLSRLENIDIVVEDWPRAEHLAGVKRRGREDLLGLYQGIPRTERGSGYNLVLPDKITIFRNPILRRCRSREEVAQEIARVVRHEIAHHFGLSDEALG